MPKFSRNLPIPRTLSAKSSAWPVTTKVLSNTIPPLSTLTPPILRHTTVSATPPRSWEITSGPELNTMTPSPSPATRVIVRTANSRRLSSIFGKDRPRKGMRLSMRSTKKRAVRRNPIRNLKSVSAAPCWPEMPPWNWNSSARLSFGCKVSASRGELPLAEASVRKLERLTDQSRDFLVANSYESARGYVLAAQGDFANAVDELAADPRSPLALDQLAAAQEKLGNTAAAEATRTRIKYLRAPTVEWYLLTTARALEPTS